MRALPPAGPAPIQRKPEWALEARVVLITRLFGGGSRAREIDGVSWLRSSAAKSALRFWWRASHAHEFSSLEALLGREGELFGSPGSFDDRGAIRGGPGALRLTTQSRLASPPVAYNEPQANPLNYALFPAQDMGRASAKVALPSDQTSAILKLASRQSDAATVEGILTSLRLWLTLGGAGARTRRGAGALAACTRGEAEKLGLPQTPEELKIFLRDHCQLRDLAPALAGVFSLARTRRVCVGPLQPTGEEAQKRLLSVLRDARQDRPRPPANSWGRSRWPEADAIRLKASPGRAWVHSPHPTHAGHYPRAVLGLPIVVHFKTPPSEPDDHHILGALPQEQDWRKLERYASPILLRSVRIWEGERARYMPVALFTECTLPDQARPLVTTQPQADVQRTDVVAGYGILSEAQSTLLRIEGVFANSPGFLFL